MFRKCSVFSFLDVRPTYLRPLCDVNYINCVTRAKVLFPAKSHFFLLMFLPASLHTLHLLQF